MSDIVAEFNPLTAPQTSFTVPQTASNGAIVFWNESNISMNLSLQNGSRFYLPAWYNKHLCGYSGSVNVEWAVRTILNSGLPPTSEVIVEAYAHGEHFPPDGSLVRQANGDTNTVTTQNTLVNDGSPAATSIIEATVAGDSASAVSITNDAQVQLGSTLHQAIINILGTMGISGVLTAAAGIDTGLIGHSSAINIQVGAQQSAQFSAGGIDTFILGGGAELIATLLQLKNASGTAQLAADSSGNINVDHPIGTRIFQINSGGIDLRSTGNILAAASVQLTTGNLSRVSRFTGTLGTVSGGNSIPHGLGTTPDGVFLQVNSNTATTTYSCTADATNVHAFGNNALSIIGYAFHA